MFWRWLLALTYFVSLAYALHKRLVPHKILQLLVANATLLALYHFADTTFTNQQTSLLFIVVMVIINIVSFLVTQSFQKTQLTVIFLAGVAWFILQIISFSSFGLLHEDVSAYLRLAQYAFVLFSINAALLGERKTLFTQSDYYKTLLTNKPLFFILLVVTLAASAIRFYNLGVHDFFEDEFQVISAATGRLNTGDYYRWDWISDTPKCLDKTNDCYYPRAWPHTFLISQVFKVFGISEFSARIISVLFGTLLVIMSYFLIKFFTQSRLTATLGMVSFALYPAYISLSRYTRMYVILIPIFFLLLFVVYKALTGTNTLPIPNKKIQQFIETYCNFDYIYVFVAMILLYFNYHIHINSLVILPITLLFLIYLSIVKKEKKYQLAVLLATVATLLLVILQLQFQIIRFTGFLSLFQRFNQIYITYLFQYPFVVPISIGLATIPLIALVKKNITGELRDKLVFLYISLSFTLLFFVFVADRYASFVYISHLTPVAITVILFGFSLVTRMYPAFLVPLFASLLIFPQLFNYINTTNRFYAMDTQYGKYSQAYEVIVTNYNSTTDIIFGQYPRDYYLNGLPLDAHLINMGTNGDYTLDQFLKEQTSYNKVWVMWESRKQGHVNAELEQYLLHNYEKLHGRGVDSTNVEVFILDKNQTTEQMSL